MTVPLEGLIRWFWSNVPSQLLTCIQRDILCYEHKNGFECIAPCTDNSCGYWLVETVCVLKWWGSKSAEKFNQSIMAASNMFQSVNTPRWMLRSSEVLTCDYWINGTLLKPAAMILMKKKRCLLDSVTIREILFDIRREVVSCNFCDFLKVCNFSFKCHQTTSISSCLLELRFI